jgi:branched-chain amino acid aminotransferase
MGITESRVDEFHFKISHPKHKREKPKDETQLPFGRYFTDHMFVMQYDQEKGWHSPEIKPYGPFQLDPAASGLHYGQSVWEGLKCYRTPDGDLQLFRPRDNFQRLNRSAERMVMPQIDIELVLSALKTLIRMDAEWVPHSPGTSVYIRPAMFATEPFLGVHPAHQMVFFIILSPVGPYYANGFSPVKIYVEDQYTRAAEGGTGCIKNSGNYAGALKAAQEAQDKGFSQVLWLDGKEHHYIEEIGMMNVMFKIRDEIVTPSLNGSILPGITRDSVIKLLRSQGMNVNERKISIEEIIEAAELGELQEAFGTGTAAVIAPIGSLTYQGKTYPINAEQTGPCAKEIYDSLTGIQYGYLPDPFEWIEKI